MNYKELLNDSIIVGEFDKIDQHHDNRFDHGKKHAENVMNNVIKLANVLGLGETEINYLCIACLLHDLGQLGGSENHYLRSKEFAEVYLKDKISKNWLDKIILAVENHHEKQNVDNLSLFEHLVLFADKMDFTNKRLDYGYINKAKEECFEIHIINVDFKVENDVLSVIISTDGKIAEKDFVEWDYYPKILKRIEEFASKLKLKYSIEIK